MMVSIVIPNTKPCSRTETTKESGLVRDRGGVVKIVMIGEEFNAVIAPTVVQDEPSLPNYLSGITAILGPTNSPVSSCNLETHPAMRVWAATQKR